MFYLVFLAVPCLLLILFAWKWPAWAPLTLLICPALDLLVYRRELFYYESRALILFFVAIQFTLLTFPALLIRYKATKPKNGV